MPRGKTKTNKKPRPRRKRRTRRIRQSHSTEPSTNHGARHSTGIGAQIGAGLGNWAEKGIRSLFGSGDYAEEHAKSGLDVEANSLVKPMTASQVPIFSTPEHLHGAVRVAHREYIGDLETGALTDTTYEYQITPLNSQLFPWLSIMSQNFQQWIAMGIVVEFVSTAGNAFSGASAALGDVNMVCEYDIEAPPLTTKQQMLNSFYATSAATSQNLMMAVECAPEDSVVTNRFLQQPGLSQYYDARLNALGNLYIRNTGSQSKYICGQLWVTYEIILLKPRVYVAPVVKSRFTGSQLVAISTVASMEGNPLSQRVIAELAAMPASEEEKEKAPTVDDVYQHLIAEGYIPQEGAADASPPLDLQQPVSTDGRLRF